MIEQRSTVLTVIIAAIVLAGIVSFFLVRSPQSKQIASVPEGEQTLVSPTPSVPPMPSLSPEPSPFPAVAGVQDVVTSAETGAADYVVPAAWLAIVLGLIGAIAIVAWSF